MLWSFLTWFFKPFGELCLALRDTKWPSTSPFVWDDQWFPWHNPSTPQISSRPLQQGLFSPGFWSQLDVFQSHPPLIGRIPVHGKHVDFSEKKNSEHFFVAKLGMTRLFETPEPTMGWKRRGNQFRIPPSIAPLVKPNRLILVGIPIGRNSALAAVEVPKDSPIANHEELEEFPKKGSTTERVQKITF